ncbi:MAG: flagellar protein FliT [Rhodothermales bacterium]
MASDPSYSLLDRIYALGERLHAALEAGETDTFFELVLERGALVERLCALEPPDRMNEDLKPRMSMLVRQHREIGTALATLENHLTSSLDKLGQVKQAQAQYRQHHQQRPHILNKNLCG